MRTREFDMNELKEKKYLSAPEAAFYCGMVYTTFMQIFKSEKPSITIDTGSSRILIDREKLENWYGKYIKERQKKKIPKPLNLEEIKAKETLSMKEAAFYVGVSVSNMQRLVHTKGFPDFIQVNNFRVFIERAKLEEWLAKYRPEVLEK